MALRRDHRQPPLISASGDSAGAAGCFQQSRELNIVAVGKPGFLARNGANTGTPIDAVRALLDDAVFKPPGLVASGLQIDIGGIHPRSQQLPHDLFKVGYRQTGGFQQALPGNGKRFGAHHR